MLSLPKLAVIPYQERQSSMLSKLKVCVYKAAHVGQEICNQCYIISMFHLHGPVCWGTGSPGSPIDSLCPWTTGGECIVCHRRAAASLGFGAQAPERHYGIGSATRGCILCSWGASKPCGMVRGGWGVSARCRCWATFGSILASKVRDRLVFLWHFLCVSTC